MLHLGSVKVTVWDMEAVFRLMYYNSQRKFRSQRGRTAGARLEALTVETRPWQFEVPSRPTHCVDGEYRGRVFFNALICLDHDDYKNGTQPHLMSAECDRQRPQRFTTYHIYHIPCS